MIEIPIPGRDALRIDHVVLDYNGTIAFDGSLVEGAAGRIRALARNAQVHILTADTYGSAGAQCAVLPATLHTFPRADAAACKLEIVQALEGGVACFGNGVNDAEMFAIADLAVAVLDGEGLWAGLLGCADVLVRSCNEGLDLMLEPSRLRATLRS